MNDAFVYGFVDEMEKCSGFFKDQGKKLLEKAKEHGPDIAGKVAKGIIKTTSGAAERTGAGFLGALKGAAQGAWKGATTKSP